MSDAMKEIEPGLWSKLPVRRLTHTNKRSIHSYYTMSPVSEDGEKLLYYEFCGAQAGAGPETLQGRLVVADADGSNPETLVEMQCGGSSSAALQQWAGDTHRVAFSQVLDGRRGWAVMDPDTGEAWTGEGVMRRTSPEGNHLFLQTPQSVHIEAQREGRSLGHDEVAARVVDFRTGEVEVRISVADVLAVHPDAEEVRTQHMYFKQTEFSLDGKYLSSVFSNVTSCQAFEGEIRRHEILIADRDGSNIRHLGAFNGHPAWDPNSRFYFAVTEDESGTRRFMSYSLDGASREPIGPADWVGGGHPSIQPGEGRYLATDLYDGKKGTAKLRIYDLERPAFEDVLAATYEDFSNRGGTHLHPTWDPDGKGLVINSANTGAAQLYHVDLA